MALGRNVANTLTNLPSSVGWFTNSGLLAVLAVAADCNAAVTVLCVIGSAGNAAMGANQASGGKLFNAAVNFFCPPKAAKTPTKVEATAVVDAAPAAPKGP